MSESLRLSCRIFSSGILARVFDLCQFHGRNDTNMALDPTTLTIGILISTSFWTILHLFVTPALSRAILPEYYGKMVRDTQKGDETAHTKLAVGC